jgi:poly [ADP-ribose] polymerase 6/8
VVASNRSHIVKLKDNQRLSFMQSQHQYLLYCSSPAKEKIFKEARLTHGSTFAFHGSGIENWHSILRQGLYNATGTKFQMNGAAYGPGIYMSPNSSVSMDYSFLSGMRLQRLLRVVPKTVGSNKAPRPRKKFLTPSRFLRSRNLKCVALCEVINKNDELKKYNNGRSIWVMPNADYVCTRFIFVFEKEVPIYDVHSESPHIQAEIQQLLDKCESLEG